MMDFLGMIKQAIEGERFRKVGKVVAELSSEEIAELETLKARKEGIEKEQKKLNLSKREVKVKRDRWWANAAEKYKLYKYPWLTIKDGKIHELIEGNEDEE